MKIDLVQYLKERYLEREMDNRDSGPVITIARETGCPGKRIAQHLQDVLNQRNLKLGNNQEWKWVGKEVFEAAAKELDLEPESVKNIFNHPRSVIDEILGSQSRKYYVNDRRIRKTIGEVIRSMANDGRVIILGRGGVALTRDISKSLHIFIEAPLTWRVSIIMEKNSLSETDATKYVKEIDKQRQQFREYYRGKGTDYTWYDVRYNCMTLCVEEIVQSIVNLMENRKLI
jgi:cytidylate kinase